MKLPLSWVNEYVDLKDVAPKKLADLLVNAGFEVEEIIDVSGGIEGIVTGKILSIEKHPNADKLSVCNVDLGKDKKLQIVTGAKNVAVDDIVPVATNGAVITGGKSINNTTMRGVLSQGMLCGGSELGVDDDILIGASVDGILILNKSTKVGVDVKDTLGLSDTVFDVSITANRADCQSIYGLAREISVILKRPLKPLDLDFAESNDDTSELVKKVSAIDIDDKTICSRYVGRFVKNVKISTSPEFIRRRLKLLGLKPINNVVDITNYVLFEVGQPLHAFDVGKIADKIWVRNTKEGEKITLLNGDGYSLDNKMLVIADAKKPLAVAGVMGGEFSGISNDTNTLFLESARFARGSIRTTARKLGLKSDSSARFEKGVDYDSVDIGSLRALSLFSKTGAGEVVKAKLENSITRPKELVVKTTAKEINDLLGIKIAQAKIVDILTRLEIIVKVNGRTLECKIPLFREDIACFADLAEEVIRFYGYDKIKSTAFKGGAVFGGGYSLKEKNIRKIKSLMISNGALEAITYSFVSVNEYDKLNVASDDALRNVIKINNPLSEDYAVMRTQLAGGMLSVVKTNLSRKNNDFRLFEIARVYKSKALPLIELPEELDTLCIAFAGADEEFYSLKNAVKGLEKLFNVELEFIRTSCSWLHPGIGADVILNGENIGSIGKIHPVVAKNFDISENVFIAQICLEKLISHIMPDIKAKKLPKFPQVERDLAVVVKSETAIGDLIKCIKNTGGALIEKVELFDIYDGAQIEKGFKSVALSLVLRADTHTLKDAEIQDAMARVLLALQGDFGAVLR